MALLDTAYPETLVLAVTLALSIALQVITSVLALRLIKIAGGRIAWILISLAVGAMALRRCITLTGIYWSYPARPTDSAGLAAELVALMTSSLLLAGIAAIGPQVAAMKRAQETLRESKETQDAILASSPVGIGLMRQGRLGWANQSLLDIFGYDLSQWMEQPPQIAFISQEDFESVSKHLWVGLLHHRKAFLDCRLVTRQGKPFDAFIQASLLDVNNRAKGMIFTVSDITRRKTAQAALRESEEKYRLVVDNANEAIFILKGNKINFPNARAATLFARPGDDLLEFPYLALVHPEDQEGLQKGLAEVVNGRGALNNHQHKLRGPYGETFWVELNAVPIEWQGEAAALCLLRDLTSQKKLERQLLHAQKMEAMGRLTGGVAHDFNNLLQVIHGYSELVLKSLNAGDPSHEHMKNVLEAARRASRLTGQLLTFSRKHLIEAREIKLNELVAGLETMLRRIIGEDILLQTRLGEDVGYVKADQGQLEQVVMNLAVNARDAMPNGGRLLIETGRVQVNEDDSSKVLGLPPGDYVTLLIRDSGCGMSKEVLSHLFEPFFTTKEHNKGTGLGLSTVYGIIKSVEGEIEVESETGKGSAFQIYLPCVPEPARERPHLDTAPQRLPRGSETLLLVEDEDHVRNLLAEALRLGGYKVLTAANGEEALNLLDGLDAEVHLIITDVVMPKMSGPQLAQRVRQTRPDAKVIFMSGYNDRAETFTQVFKEGGAFLQKPFTVESLGRKVREVLGEIAAYP